jgi:anti-anti-sigma regulatory factor
MIRITTERQADRIVIKVEGKLAHAWVQEADASWRTVCASANGQPIAVDLCDVYAIDDGGRELLTRMHQAGAQLMVRGCLMPEVLREIREIVERQPTQNPIQEGTRA